MAGPGDPFDMIAHGNVEFSQEFFRVLNLAETGNVVASPLCCLISLAMICTGAKGKSKNKIAEELRLPEDFKLALKGLRKMIKLLKKAQKMKLLVANRIYIKDGTSVSKTFTSITKKYFEDKLERIAFTGPSTADNINNWVSKRTTKQIQNLVDSNSFDDSTRMFVVNAIHFKGVWLKPFKMENTHILPFFTDETNSIKVPFMHQKERFLYKKIDELDAQMLILSYKGLKVSMAILLPNTNEGLNEMMEKLASVNLRPILLSGNITAVEVFLPKFEIETTLDIINVVSRMGLGHIFSENVDLSGISSAEGLKRYPNSYKRCVWRSVKMALKIMQLIQIFWTLRKQTVA
ncbi:serine protease inhibitor 3/4-like isoform X2 [Cloeon dipterum]|uniref:serine protease inhibitor 3/4-like isoform X2 n=1 Tax=Cloeon dipterum TaxID=197152 RepID=UPI00321FDF37